MASSRRTPPHMNGGGTPAIYNQSSQDLMGDDLEYLDPTAYFERGRIKQLQDERVTIQKKTFTKWCNSFLNRARLEVVDLFADLCDGVLLLKLLEIISGDKLGKPNRGRMRVHKIENLNKTLDYLKRKKIHMENIGAEDILDGNHRLILGLIWTIILRFQIEDIEIEVDENESSEKKYAKDALLLWCQRKTAGYAGVKIDNFTTSWRNGLGFNALIHAHRPDLINYNALNPQDHIANLNNAFDVAEKKLGIARLLDAEDIDVNRPDEKSVITYVSMYYHYFAKQKSELTGAKRIAKIVGQLVNAETSRKDYANISNDLLSWIRQKIQELHDRRFPNSLKGIQEEMLRFKQYRTVEKPPKYKEKGELEALFFAIQTKHKALKIRPFVPPQGLLLHDIETAWGHLESAEHARQVALHEELLRQERLEQLARKFERKAKLRESWLREMSVVLQDFDFGKTASQVEASVKKHEAISADILPREDRIRNLSVMAAELTRENYHNQERIRGRERDIMDRWAALLQVLDKRRKALMSLNELMAMLIDIDALSSEITLLETIVRNRDLGKHKLGVDDLLQKHDLIEAQISGHGEWLKNIVRQGQVYVRNKGTEYEMLQKKLTDLQGQYDNLLQLSQVRRLALEKSSELFQFIQDQEEEESWLHEKRRVCQSIMNQSDLMAVQQYQRSLKTTETEMQGHWQRTKKVMGSGEKLLVHANQPTKDEVQSRLKSLQHNWDQLRTMVAELSKWLREAQQAGQYFQEANEAESWMREKMPLVCSDDFGRDEVSAQALLTRQNRLEEEICAYKTDIQRLESMAEELSKAEYLAAATNGGNGAEDHADVLSPQVIIEQRLVPQVRVLYKYEGKGKEISVQRGEILNLLQKTDGDWWLVSKQTSDGAGQIQQRGFVPANYVQEIEPKVVEVAKKQSPTKTSPQKQQTLETTDADLSGAKDNAVTVRQNHINAAYGKLIKLAQTRRRYLEDAIKLYKFYRECDDFEQWARETEVALNERPAAMKDVEASRKKFDDLVTDIVANGGTRINEINRMADELVEAGHSQKDHIRRRQNEVNDLWKSVLKKRDTKGQALLSAESVAQFNQICEETRSWMQEKSDFVGGPLDTKDAKGLQAEQRRQQNLERELKAVETKMKALQELADRIRATHPEQAAAIDDQVRELQKLWEKLKQQATERRKRLEETQGHQMFQNAVQDLVGWIQKTKSQLLETEKAISVQQAEELLEKHGELGNDIKAHDDEFLYVEELGHRLTLKSVNVDEVDQTLTALKQDQIQLKQLWDAKQRYLEDMLEEQLFNREADHIDAATKGHEAFLDLADLGNSVESVENLLKQHNDFENKLYAQDERLRAFSEMADRLIEQEHPASPSINERRSEVFARRNAVKEKAKNRRAKLESSLDFHTFKRDAEELGQWTDEKMKLANDDSYKDGTNLERKLKKNEAFEAELRANADRLQRLTAEGEELMEAKHPKSPEIKSILNKLTDQWKVLELKTRERGEKLRQANEQKNLNRTLDDAHLKLDEMEKALASDDLGHDLHSVKQLIQVHTMLEQEMTTYAGRIRDIVSKGEDMAKRGHYDSKRILNSVEDFNKRFASLQGPAARRRGKLEESLKWQQFKFDIDCELQWIGEKMPIALSNDCGKSLTDAVNLRKKHEQLEAEISGHQSVVDKVLAEGNRLITSKHFATDEIRQASQLLTNEWTGLKGAAGNRRAKLDLALKGQQYLSNAADVETWITEKKLTLNSKDMGKDEDAAGKLLARQKAIQAEMKTYEEILKNLANDAACLIRAQHPDLKQIENRQRDLEAQFDELGTLAERRRVHLEDAACMFQYLRESKELEEWINEQLQIAMSEDYGRDYEHLMEILSKFDDFKHQVTTGAERFKMCENSAKMLLEREPPFAVEIQHRQEQLRAAWSLLLDYIETRDQKLAAAEEIHRFNRDVAESLSRIQEKYASISDDLGRDINSVQSLVRRHEAFENELVALEGQLQVLLDDSARLQREYPGENAEHIAQQQHAVLEHWNALEAKTLTRRNMLKAAYELQRFLAMARDLISWTQEVLHDMRAERTTRDLQAAELLHDDHRRLKSELSARSEDFQQLQAMAEEMIRNNHYAETEIKEKLQQTEAARQRMLDEWMDKEKWLQQLVQWHAFQRDANQILTIVASYEASLKSGIVGSTVEEVSAAIRKHETFEKLLEPLGERVQTLQQYAQALITQKHMESPNIEATASDVERQWLQLLQTAKARRRLLQDAQAYAKFSSDVCEAESWISEKHKKLALEEQQGQVTSLQEKMQRLQKHQAFEAELTAHQSRIADIEKQADVLMREPELTTENKTNVKKQKSVLLAQWTSLVKASQDQSRSLEEARDILNFQQLLERILTWIKEKELMIAAGSMGRDYEDCLSLKKKLNDMETETVVDEETIAKANQLGEKLVKQGRSEKKEVQHQLEDLNTKWRSTQASLVDYRHRLEAALEVHAFNRDVDDTSQRIHEKSILLSSDDYGKDLATVEVLLRKHETVERDMTAIEQKLRAHETAGKTILAKDPPLKETVTDSLKHVFNQWQRLCALADSRRNKLRKSHELHKFLEDVASAELWSSKMKKKLRSYAPPRDVHEAKALLDGHKEKKAEMSGRQEILKQLRQEGERLKETQPEKESEIGQALEKLDQIDRDVVAAWEMENSRLSSWHELQIFNEIANLTESWLASKEAFLHNDDVGESLDAVETLLKKHDAFETTVRAQSEKVKKLEKEAEILSKKDPEHRQEIVSRCGAVVQRHRSLLESCQRRKLKLEHSRQWHRFLKNCYELMSWINAKLQIAYDESYLDPTNLQSKLQKHAAFDAELKTNEARIEAIVGEGQKLIKAGHFAKDQIQLQLNEIEAGWKELTRASTLKSDRLREAYDAYQFNRRLEDMDRWLDSVETQLASDDHGKDLASVGNLLAKHEALEQKITSRQHDVEDLKTRADEFVTNLHFMGEEMKTKTISVAERFDSLKEPCQIRRENLKEAQSLFQWYREADDETAWLRDRRPLIFMESLGDSLQSAVNLMKKHQTIEQDLQSHEPHFDAFCQRGRKMINEKHFASHAINDRLNKVESEMEALKDQAALRRLKLRDAVEAQQYYTEASEAEDWLQERKHPLVAMEDMGNDEHGVASLLKKLDVWDRDIAQYKKEIDRLGKAAEQMTSRRHFDSVNIEDKQKKLEQLHHSLLEACQKRKALLADAGRYYKYLRQADELIEWLRDKESAVNSEDYGRDLEHCQLLIEQFEQLVRELSAAGERVAAVVRFQEDLLRAGHPYSASIKAKGADLQHLWSDINEAATERQQALIGARQVHKFDQDADETLNWLQEKEALLVTESTDDLGQTDLPTIQAKIQRHDVFMRELTAAEKQVDSLSRVAERLIAQYPNTREHLDVRRQDMGDILKDVLSASKQKYDRLKQAEQLQAYFGNYRDLIGWINEMHGKITSETLPRDVPSAEALVIRHREYQTEIDARSPMIDEFINAGKEMIRQKHLLSQEVQEKIDHLENSFQNLFAVWNERKTLYEINMDALNWKRDAAALEAWMVERSAYLGDDWKRVESLAAVEDNIRQFDDFLKTLQAQEEKFETLKSLTLLEQMFSAQREREEERRHHEEQRREEQRKNQIKTLEKQKILQERRQERERRRTQEIQLYKPQPQPDSGCISPMILRKTSEGLTIAPAGSIEVEQPAAVSSEKRDSLTSTTAPILKPPIPPKPPKTPELVGYARPRSFSSDGADIIISVSGPNGKSEFSTIPTQSTPSSSSTGAGVDIRKVQSFRQGGTMETTPRLTPKRTPSFTTRRHHSLKKVRGWNDIQQIEKEGYIERKQDLQSGGKKATIRSWKKYYTVLCGQLMCFFKDEEAFHENMAAAPPVYILHAQCAGCPEYHKRKYTFRLKTQDGSEYLFAASNDSSMDDWMKKISFHAALPPSMQLKSFEERHQIASAQSNQGSMLSPASSGHYEPPLPLSIPPNQIASSTSNTVDSGFLPSGNGAGSYHSPPHKQPPPPVPTRQFSVTRVSVNSNGDRENGLHFQQDGLLNKSNSSDQLPLSPSVKSATLPTGAGAAGVGSSHLHSTNSLRRNQREEDGDWVDTHGSGGRRTPGSTQSSSSISHDHDTSSIAGEDEKKKEKRVGLFGSFFKSSKSRRESREFKDPLPSPGPK